MVKLISTDLSNSRSSEYAQYLEEHVRNVQKVWGILYSALISDLDSVISYISISDTNEADYLIQHHDETKYSAAEYNAYLEYFYPSDGGTRDFDDVPPVVEDNFNKAWLHHQNCNPHHWQYWCLIKDDGTLIPTDMSVSAIIEMVCDWHSFSAKNPESTAYKWYNDNKHKMILSDPTRDIIEDLVELLKDPLTL